MSLLNPALLAGLGLAIIPVLLHLLLRAKPKRLIFPALRLIQMRRRQNVRRMQLRHVWLLLLRIAAIALIVLAVCRPSLPPANYSPNRLEWASLIGIVALSLGAYFGVMIWWQRQNMTRSALLTRRTMLRGGIGALALILALLAVAWPYARRLSSEIKNPAPRAAENIPVAAIFLFDNSISMSYKQANKTRLRAAQDMAKSYLGNFPNGSKVAVAASHETTPAAFSSDLVAGQSRIDGMEIKAASLPLNDRLKSLLQVQQEDQRRVTSEQILIPEDKRQDRFIREIYVFTDLTKSAWRDAGQLLDDLQRLRWINIYIIDVGESAPVNTALTELKLSREAVPARTPIRVDAIVSAIGQVKPDQTVELYLKTGDGPFERKGAEPVKLEPGREARVSFFPVDLPPQPLTQGELRLTGSDPLSADDLLYFTVKTIPSLRVLIVAEQPAISRLWTLALEILTESKVMSFQVEQVTTSQLVDRDLNGLDVVFLINAKKPSDAAWNKLQTFVEAGGGLGVFLGASSSLTIEIPTIESINPVGYQSPAAMQVLPARAMASLPHTPAKIMDLRKSKHLLLTRFEEVGALTELSLIEVRRYWKVEPNADAVIVARYSGADEDSTGPVALIERRLGQGRVLMMTTGVDGISWNDLPANENGSYLVFADQITQYLASQASATFNHVVGDEVSLPLDREHKISKAILRMPDFKQRMIDIPPQSTSLTLRDLSAVGSYSVDSADRAAEYHSGFSLNLRAAESDLRRLETSELDAMLGEKRYSMSRDLDGLVRDFTENRLGQEVYGMVVALLIAVFALEQFTATWFYRTDEA